jgi:hypothetical protein
MMGKVLSTLANLVSTAGHGALAFYGDDLQALAHQHIIRYEPYMGQLSDYAGAAAASSALMLLFVGANDKWTKYVAPLMISTMYTLQELSQTLPSSSGTFDPKDIVAYFAGATVAAGLCYATEEVDEQKLVSNIKGLLGQYVSK